MYVYDIYPWYEFEKYQPIIAMHLPGANELMAADIGYSLHYDLRFQIPYSPPELLLNRRINITEQKRQFYTSEPILQTEIS